ncbi:zona pellucida sperm-binding protein 1 [Melopsittacus undulatus]|uniref:zona pellucida sperm-binding protein 1 n=1 Tax=Melopsittacus undulatus TaxID=13146 RepID=UPI00146C36B6|nr:zona pellucida sperm-binding protein 1 [Melopsittacus undulatus]
MGWSRSLRLLLLLLVHGPGALSLLQYRYECREHRMQLEAHPGRGRSARFRVLDESGTPFDVANCSICLHWLHSRADGAIVFSSGYEGCHVLVKGDRYVLRVQLEETLPNGVPVTSYGVNMTCPKPAGDEHPFGGHGNGIRQSQAGVLVPLSQPGLLHHISQSSISIPGSRLTSQVHPEPVPPPARAEPQDQMGMGHPGLQTHSQPALVHPGAPDPAGAGGQSQRQTGMVRPGAQHQPGLLQPLIQTHNQPGVMQSMGQNPSGHVRPGVQTHNQPGLMHSMGQNQQGHIRPGVQTHNQPGLMHSMGQNQQGHVRPGVQTHNQPGVMHSIGQNQQGHIRPAVQTHNQPGLMHSMGQNPSGHVRPGVQTHNQPGLMHSMGQNQQGHIRPGVQTHNQPGLMHSMGQNQQGHVRPGVQTHNQPGVIHSMGQNQPGHIRPGVQTQTHAVLVHPGAQAQAGAPHAVLAPQNQPGLVHGTSGFMHTSAQTHTGFLRPAAHPPTHPNPQPHSQGSHVHPGMLHPSHSRPGMTHPGLQSRPGLLRPGLHAQPHPGLGRPGLQPQAQPGLMRPGLQSQPSLLQSTALFYPSAGAGTPLSREQCQVAVGRMPCVAPQGRDACLQAGCCYDDMDRTVPCYYGNTATVQCLLEGQFVLVVPRGLSTQPYNLDSVRLASSQPGCEPLRVTEAFVMFRFAVTQCGTTAQVIEDQLIYENQLISTIDVQGSPRGSITRDSIYILQARCIYNASDLLPLRMEVAIPTTAAAVARPGPLGLQLRIATDESYSSYHPDGDFPLVKVLRDPIYVEVRLLHKTDPNLVLVLHQCWAAPSTEPTAQPQWPILVDGCPFVGDNYRTQLVPVGPASPQLPFPSHYQRFIISTFTFVEPPSMAVLEGEVFISCSASVCHLAQPEPCRPSCHLGVPSRARRSPRGRRTGAMGTVSSQGSITFPMGTRLQRGRG